MEDSVLNSIKQMLGVEPDDTSFNTDIMVHINTQLMVLNQIGVGNGERVHDETLKWSGFIVGDVSLDAVISYVYIQVKLLFDPPSSQTTIASMKETANELYWRLCSAVDCEEGYK